MKEQFTKGEWEVDLSYSTMLSVSVIHDAFNATDVCDVESDVDYQAGSFVTIPTIEQLANAHLIAAAPDMYLLLADISKSIDHCGDEIDTDFVMSSIDKLLSKARGE